MQYGKKSGMFLVTFLLILSLCFPCAAETEGSAVLCAYSLENVEQWGASDSFVSYPLFSANEDEAGLELAARLNDLIQDYTKIPAYLQLLSGIQEGGTGLKFNYATSSPCAWNEQLSQWGNAPYISFLFSAEGKMLAGRPSQVYYPITVDMTTGEPVPFDALFTDPEGAKARIESILEEEVEPALSTYLENSQLIPVPYDRYYLDGFGHLTIYYEQDQLSFLSGYAGAVSFRYSELWDYLDTSAQGICMTAQYSRLQYTRDAEKPFSAMLDEWMANASIIGFGMEGTLGMPLDDALHLYRQAADSEFYPGGACLEAEESALRGTLLLIDEDETKLQGVLSSRADFFGIETGKTALQDAEALIGREPDALIPMNESAAELYRVCVGTAAVYSNQDADGKPLTFTLYADENNVVQYIKFAYAQ